MYGLTTQNSLFFSASSKYHSCALQMSISYSDGLSPYTNKGVLGRPEVYDCPRELNRKVDELVTAIKSSKLFCVITGAGIR